MLGEREGVSIYLSIVLACSAVWKRGQLELSNIISSEHLYYGLIAAAVTNPFLKLLLRFGLGTSNK